MKKKFTTSVSLLIFFFIITGAFAQSLDSNYDISPGGQSWADSYQANGLCWCESTFDHGLDDVNSISFVINGVKRNIEDICDELKNHPSFRASASGDSFYNDIQCGNGPANNDSRNDETYCPGIVTNGNEGCTVTGPTWDLAWLASRSRFGGNGSLISDQIIENGKYYIESPYLQERLHSDYGIGYNAKMEVENTSGENQVWSFIYLGGDNIYSIRNETNYRYLEVNSGSCTNSANVGTWFKNEDEHQKWKVVANGSNYNLLPLHCDTKAMDRNMGSAGAEAIIYNHSTSNGNQKWNLTPVENITTNTIVTILGETISSYITYDDAYPHYVRADNGTTNNTFVMEFNEDDSTYSFKSSTGNYISSENGQPYVTCNRNTETPGSWERFELELLESPNVYAIKWKNGNGDYLYLSHENNRFPMNCDRSDAGTWERFVITSVEEHSSKQLVLDPKTNESSATFYPSPVSPDEMLSARVILNEVSTVEIQILDVLGRVFAKKKFSNLEAGTNLITLGELQNSISTTGVYILKLAINDKLITKMIQFD
ncbi:RICIN domain-containing protein [Aquimarina pacifica]|uniref:RICIN domain-containing protein n=1 Tax=Aquimarina pacifica TaxID=1296415 RepID=UPI0004724AB6|nr:RICIN domain-containing protein [Aquimarina pacifica]